MPVSIDQWHAAIGLFGAYRYVAIIKKRILKKQPKYSSCRHWNVNSLLADNKISN